MKAVVYEKYGSPEVLEFREIEKPTVMEDDVLVKIHAASMNPMDVHFRSGTPFMARLMTGLLKPKSKILGFDFAGKIESVGENVEQFKKDDDVFGLVPPERVDGGANAEYVCVSEKDIALKPVNMTYEQAAAVPVAAPMALQGLRDKGNIKPGQRVLINGASGGIGTFAVQIAKSFGVEVTGVCSTRNLELVKSIGADEVIDYTKEDFTKKDQSYNLIFDVVAKNSFSKCKNALTPEGIYVTTAYGPKLLLQKYWTSMTSSKKMIPMWGKRSKEDLIFLRDLIEAGKITSVIDRVYPLNEIAEAHRYVGKGHARGKVIITL
ncbi:MAG: NAD(P)-dependent alcohol dehydrogenase [archaeon]|nr:NAD(P)-dependent alcohol dehydrogenase [archaeon]MCP8305803.1 NAD(P)-dependent alcohol dehydrogenase [archaeon]